MENKRTAKASSSTRHYFVDEGGDGILFSRKGKVLVGTEGCSRFFILGLLDVSDPMPLGDRLVHDIDDTRETSDGVYYTQKRPLTVSTLQRRE